MKKPIELTIKKCRKSLYRRVRDIGADYRYIGPDDTLDANGCLEGSCYNVVDGVESCLIGQMIVDLGVPVDQVPPMSGSSHTLESLRSDGWITWPESESQHLFNYLGVVQGAQDAVEAGSKPQVRQQWGTAMANGDAYLRANGLLA